MNHPERYCGGPNVCLMMDTGEGGGDDDEGVRDDHGGSYSDGDRGGGGDGDECIIQISCRQIIKSTRCG